MGFWLTMSHLVLAAVVLGLLLFAWRNIKRQSRSEPCGVPSSRISFSDLPPSPPSQPFPFPGIASGYWPGGPVPNTSVDVELSRDLPRQEFAGAVELVPTRICAESYDSSAGNSASSCESSICDSGSSSSCDSSGF